MSSLPMTEASGSETRQGSSAPPADGGRILVCLPAVTNDGMDLILDKLKSQFPDGNLLVAGTNISANVSSNGDIHFLPYPAEPAHSGWVLTSSDYGIAANLALEKRAGATLLLGTDASSLSGDGLRTLCSAVTDGSGDLVLPRYEIGPNEGLVSAALLHPISQALFGVSARVPLPLDVAFSARMAGRFSLSTRRSSSLPGSEPLLWPASEAATASLVVQEVSVGKRSLPHPNAGDLNSLLAHILGSLFADVELKASFWQRARAVPSNGNSGGSARQNLSDNPADMAEVREMSDAFRNAYTNLQEIWSLVLPPQSLLALKKLSLSAAESFTMPTGLWARTVYDFILAYRLRTINRGHLLGALTPLYLAWVASHLRTSDNDAHRAEQHIEDTASAFVTEKPYLLARWRWPDRFNP